MKLLLIFTLLCSLSFSKIYIESNYPLRSHNFNIIEDGEVDILLWVLKNLRDVRKVDVIRVGKDVLLYVDRYPIVKEVRIEGNWFATDEDIKGVAFVREGEPLVDFDPRRAEENLKLFYSRRGFLDAEASVGFRVNNEGYAYVSIKIQEGELYFLKGVLFEGNKAVEDAKLLEASGLQLGSVFNKELARNAVLRLQSLYEELGFFGSSVYLREIKRLKLSSPFFRVLTPGAEGKTLWSKLLSVARGASNLTSHPMATLKALLGKGYGAVPLYEIYEGRKYRIVFKGNRFFSSTELENLIDRSAPGIDVFFLENLKSSIQKLYRAKGFFDVNVEYSHSREGVEFLIKEGARYRLRVEGLKGLGLPPFYDEEEIRKRLEDFLRNQKQEGYLSATIETEKRVDRAKKEVLLKVTYKRGKKVWLRDVKYLGEDREVKSIFSKYRALLPSILDEKLLDNLHKEIKDYLTSKGYLDGDFSLTVLVEEDDENLFISHLYTLSKGQRYRYGKLLIYGNEKTRAREIYYIVVKEKYFSPQAEEESLWNLIQSENFTGVRIEHFVDRKNKVVHRLVEVREDRRGSLELGVGYNTEEDFKIEGSLTLKNLFGVGIALRLSASRSQKYETYEINLWDKFFFSRKYFTDMSLFRRLEFRNSFNLESEGFSFAFGYRPLRWLSLSPFFSNTLNRVSGAGEGNFRVRKAGLLLVFERKDDPLNPRKVSHLSVRVSNSWGDRSYYKAELNTFLLREITPRMLLNSRLYIGWVGRKAPIFDRFFLGGLRDMRSYDYESIGYPEGGRVVVFARLEPLFTVKKPFWTGVYVETGNVADNLSEAVGGLKYGIGFALGLDTPAGFLRLDAAKPLQKLSQPFSKVRLYLSIGFVY